MTNIFKNWFSDAKDFSDKKVRNPFFITYFLVLLYRNWEIVFTFFNFDDDCTLNDKIFIIKNYFKKVDLLNEILLNLWYTFLVLVFSYILVFVFRAISNFFERKVIPLADKIDSNLIVTKELFNREKLQKEEYREKVISLRKINYELHDKISELSVEIKNLINTKEEDEISIKNLKIKIQKAENEIKNKITAFKPKNDRLNYYLSELIVSIFYKVFSDHELKNIFLNNYNVIIKKIPNSELRKLIDYNLIYEEENSFNIVSDVLYIIFKEIKFDRMSKLELQTKVMSLLNEKILTFKKIHDIILS